MPRKKKRKKRGTRDRNENRANTRKPGRRSDDIQLPEGFSTPVIKHYPFDNPLGCMTDEQKCELTRTIGDKAARSFERGLEKLESAVKSHDPIELLSTAAFYCLFKGIGPSTDFTHDGPYTQAVVETLQSFCLRFSLDEFGSTPILHPYLFDILDTCQQCTEDFGTKRFTSFADTDTGDRGLLFSIESARLHTQVVRNWGHPQHMREIVRELFEPLESEIAALVGVGPIAFLELTDQMSRLSCERAFQFTQTLAKMFRQTNLRKMINAFCQLAGSSKAEAEHIYEMAASRPGSLEDKRTFFLSFFHQSLPELFLFSINDCVKLVSSQVDKSRLKDILDDLSFKFGDLASENPEHLVMQSKIRTRPLVKIDEDTYFLPVHGLLNSFFLEIVEGWLRPHDDLKTRYHKRRAMFLEVILERMLQEAFPGCLVRAGTTWNCPHDRKEYENDCFVVCGPVALVFEAKSERVDDAARRGADKTLTDHYRTLVSEPAEQAARFARLLEDGQGVTTFKTKKGSDFDLNLSDIRRAVCISVTLDSLPAMTLCWQQLIKSGLVEANRRPAISLSLADLIVTLEVLESPPRRLHYFWRRIEWEENVFYLGDEEDVLVYYLSSGLPILKSQDPKATPTSMLLYGNSVELRRYYMAKWIEPDTSVPLPRRILTAWWSSLLRRIEALEQPDRWDIACIVLDLSFEQQQAFELHSEEVVQAVRQHGNDCGKNGAVTYGHGTESEGAIVGFAYRSLSTHERNNRAVDFVAQIQQESSAKRVVVIGRNVDRLGDPYDFLSYVRG